MIFLFFLCAKLALENRCNTLHRDFFLLLFTISTSSTHHSCLVHTQHHIILQHALVQENVSRVTDCVPPTYASSSSGIMTNRK